MAAVPASAGGFDFFRPRAARPPRDVTIAMYVTRTDPRSPTPVIWIANRLANGGNSDDPEKLARTYQAEQAPCDSGHRPDPFCDPGRRTARARLWPDPRQRAAPHPALFAAGCRGAVGAH